MRLRMATADHMAFVREILEDQLQLLGVKVSAQVTLEISGRLRGAQLHMLHRLLRQLDVAALIDRASRAGADATARQLAQDAEELSQLILQQIVPRIVGLRDAAAAAGAAPEEDDVVHCCTAVLSAVISNAPQAEFEVLGAEHLALLLRGVREAAQGRTSAGTGRVCGSLQSARAREAARWRRSRAAAASGRDRACPRAPPPARCARGSP